MVGGYPKRPKFFALRFCRLMAKVCLANEIGADACWLLAVIAHTEDAKGYRSDVTFFNGQLMPLVGCKTDDSLARMRAKAVKAGWLVYAPGGKGKPGRYWVEIPAEHRDWDDAPSDEGAEVPAAESVDTAVRSPAKTRTEPRENRGERAGTTAEEPRENRDRSRAEVRNIPPVSVSIPVSRPTDPQTPVGPDPEPEPFDPLRAEQAARKRFEQRWNAAGLRKFSRLSHSLHSRLATLLGDTWWAEHYPAALERAGTIPWLRDGTGRQRGAYDVGEFLRDPDEVRKLIDGVYDPHLPMPPPGPPLPKPPVADPVAATKQLAANFNATATRTKSDPCTTPSTAPTGSSPGSATTRPPSA